MIRKLPISCILDFILNTYCGGWVADSIGGSNWAHINGFLSSKLPAKQDVGTTYLYLFYLVDIENIENLYDLFLSEKLSSFFAKKKNPLDHNIFQL